VGRGGGCPSGRQRRVSGGCGDILRPVEQGRKMLARGPVLKSRKGNGPGPM
jgi:hypothetical protein